MYPQHSHFPIETPRDASTRVEKYLIEAVKVFQYQETNHPGRHTHALETLTKIFRDATEKFPEETPTQAQTSTNPMQTHALHATPRNHQRVTRSNTPGIIYSHLQNPTTKTY